MCVIGKWIAIIMGALNGVCVEMELKVVKKDLQFASANSNTKVVDMVSLAPPYAPPAKFK